MGLLTIIASVREGWWGGGGGGGGGVHRRSIMVTRLPSKPGPVSA